MILPANIRVNATFPFPSLVQGTGPITIGKTSGIWNVGFSIDKFAEQIPLPAAWPTDFFLVWDAVNQVFFKVSISDLAAIFVSSPGVRQQRLVTGSPIVIVSNDSIINCNIAGAATCALPASAGRVGAPLTFKDLGQASTHPIVITPNGAETIDGAATYTLNNNRQGVTLVPFNDGFNSGWSIE